MIWQASDGFEQAGAARSHSSAHVDPELKAMHAKPGEQSIPKLHGAPWPPAPAGSHTAVSACG